MKKKQEKDSKMINEKQIKLSPSSLDLFLECPHCFWLEKKQGIRRPPPYPYALNMAVDYLLKREFDGYRATGEPHPLLIENNVRADLFPDQRLIDEWRDNSRGLKYYDSNLDAIIFGAIDDVLKFSDDKLAPLDYKSTGGRIARVYDRFQLQMDVYNYLLEKNGYSTPKKGYLAFYVVDKEKGFDDKLPFKKELHEIETDPSYVPDLFKDAVALLKRNEPPPHSQDCEFGKWFHRIKKFH